MYDVTHKELLERMLARVPDSLDKREGSIIFDTHSPTALELELLYVELNRIIAEAFVDTASRQYLILRCKERGITPRDATSAVLKGIFEPSNIDVSGKRFNLGEINYKVLNQISPGVYQVRCETPGIVGNQYLGVMMPIEYIAGLEHAELTEILVPGEDEEDTEDLRKRYYASFEESAFGGNRKDYLEKLEAIPGVGSVKINRAWNIGINPRAFVPSVAVDNWYQTTIATLEGETQQWLRAVYEAAKAKMLVNGGIIRIMILDSSYNAASQTLIQTVQNIIDPPEHAGEGYGVAPMGHVVLVDTPQGYDVDIQSDIAFDRGYNWENLQETIRSAVENYLLDIRKSWGNTEQLIVRISQIEMRLLQTPGVVDVGNTRINGKAENLMLPQDNIPILRRINDNVQR